ncbi:hypothetical protein DUT93_14615 [Bacteroides xylanisolvens]|nr:hypothetical protein [Bacteroides xylanisolvens]
MQGIKGTCDLFYINSVLFTRRRSIFVPHSNIQTAIASALYTNKYDKTKNSNYKPHEKLPNNHSLMFFQYVVLQLFASC